MSGLELNKIAAAVLVAGLIAMICGTIARAVYAPEEPQKRGYQVAGIAVDEAQAAAPEEEAANIAALMAAASADAGKKVSKKCLACHTFDKGGADKVGPNLYGVLGDKMARNAGFNYSQALRDMGAKEGGWGYEELFEFMKNPKGYVPGTKMAFVGLKKPEDIANMIAYLRSMSDNPYPLPQE